MELSYKARGADGKEYGPVSLNQLINWLQEGRISPQSEIMRSDMSYWSRAGDFTELQTALPSGAPSASNPNPQAAMRPLPVDPALLAQRKSAASWFYWIAGLSLVNSFAAFSGSDWRFILGLGITQIIDGMGQGSDGAGKFIALAMDLVAAGTLIAFGMLGNRGHTWAFIVGMALFAMDGVIFLLAQDWIGVAFHGFVLWGLFRGFSACRALKSAA